MGKYPIKRGYQKWEKHNIEVFKKQAQYFLNGVAKPKLVDMLHKVAEEIVAVIDDNGDIPIYTGNLHDATGVGVYVDGALSKYLPTKKATRKQSSGFNYTNWYGIDGYSFLQSAMEDASTEFNSGCWIVLFSAVPYAFHIEDQTSFFSLTVGEMVRSIILGLVPLKPETLPEINSNNILI